MVNVKPANRHAETASFCFSIFLHPPPPLLSPHSLKSALNGMRERETQLHSIRSQFSQSGEPGEYIITEK